MERWGDHYDFMVTLDADSLMAGATLVEMTRRIAADPSCGILQAPPAPVGRVSVLARWQQFAAKLYSPAFLRGFALWTGREGNYWGHNAILRVAAFRDHCDLPVLPGVAPLGGEILSHDFIEAALMRRAGWGVCLAEDLAGSYEECPTTLLDWAKRDQRVVPGEPAARPRPRPRRAGAGVGAAPGDGRDGVCGQPALAGVPGPHAARRRGGGGRGWRASTAPAG